MSSCLSPSFYLPPSLSLFSLCISVGYFTHYTGWAYSRKPRQVGRSTGRHGLHTSASDTILWQVDCSREPSLRCPDACQAKGQRQKNRIIPSGGESNWGGQAKKGGWRQRACCQTKWWPGMFLPCNTMMSSTKLSTIVIVRLLVVHPHFSVQLLVFWTEPVFLWHIILCLLTEAQALRSHPAT